PSRFVAPHAHSSPLPRTGRAFSNGGTRNRQSHPKTISSSDSRSDWSWTACVPAPRRARSIEELPSELGPGGNPGVFRAGFTRCLVHGGIYLHTVLERIDDVVASFSPRPAVLTIMTRPYPRALSWAPGAISRLSWSLNGVPVGNGLELSIIPPVVGAQ